MQTEEMNRPDTAPEVIGNVEHCEDCGQALVREPVLKCRKCGHTLKLRCFYYPDGSDNVIAECIDLDLAVERKTAEEALKELQYAIHGYLMTAFEEGSIKGLVPRPAPLLHRLRYHVEKLRQIGQLASSGQRSRAMEWSFPVPEGFELC